jgi:8-oxo-dGTP pyrophosphatase MutT (NUDIX family)
MSAMSFDFTAFTSRLERRLAEPLPGLPAQLAMAPRPRRVPADPFDPERALPAAVLAILFQDRARDGLPQLALTRRTDRVASHKGQICLPGGALDPGETPVAAALREAHEEIGVAPDMVRVVGRLTPVFISVSGYRMEPFVAVAAERPPFRVAQDEVDELLEVSLQTLLDPSLRAERVAPRDGVPVVIPYFSLEGGEVWGATAMVLAELASVLADVGIGAPRER